MNQATKAIKAVKKERKEQITNPITKKDNDSIIDNEELQRKSGWLEEYEELATFRVKPISQAILDRIGAELIEHAETTEEPLMLNWFFIKKKIEPATASKWAAKYERFGKMYKLAKMILGMRREDGAMRKKFDPGTVNFTMPMYNDEWKELVKWRESIKTATSLGGEKPTSINFYGFKETPQKFIDKQVESELE